MGKQGMISPQLVDHEQFLDAYKSVVSAQFLKPAVEAKEANFQFLLDSSKLTLWTKERKLFFGITVPILEEQEWTIQRVHPLPTKRGKAFLAPLIETPYYILTNELFMNVDQEYLEKL